MYGERLNQLDLRFGKRLRFGARSDRVNVDLYNALNATPFCSRAPPTGTGGAVGHPGGRDVKFSVQFDF